METPASSAAIIRNPGLKCLMLDRNSNATSTCRAGFRRSGFTLTELLVTITIIVVLAALSVIGVTRMKIAAAKSVTTNQMRQISAATYQWAAENNNGEPFYAANGSGTYSHECVPGNNPKLAPGNPAMLLYNKDSPHDGYFTDHTLFYSPLVKFKAPARMDYAPDQASLTKLWGSYAWFYPANVGSQLTSRQANAIGPWSLSKVSNSAAGKLMLATDYLNSPPVWKRIYLALMVDGSAREVAQTEEGWKKWAWDQ